MEVVVLPTPPFWLATAIVLPRAAANSTLSEQFSAHFVSDQPDSPDFGPHSGNLAEGKVACKGKPVEKMFHVEHFGLLPIRTGWRSMVESCDYAADVQEELP